MVERAKSRGGKQSLPNIGSIKGNGQGSPIATARHKFLTKKATMPASNFPVRMNSVLRQIKPKLLEHYYNTEDPQSQVLVLQQQIDTLNKRVEVYRAEHLKLKERFEGDFVNDPAILEAQIRKTDQEIKDLQRHNAQQQIKNHGLIKHVQQQHAVSHHRVTLDDDTAYHMRAKTKKGELDRLRLRIEAVDREIEINDQTF
jgi:hypothetical protein